MALTPEDVLNKHFTATQFRRGYDEQEVDDFLDEVVVELRRLASENSELRSRAAVAVGAEGGSVFGGGGTLEADLVASQEAMEEAQARAARAEVEARERIAAAVAEAERAEREAQERIEAARVQAAQAEAVVEVENPAASAQTMARPEPSTAPADAAGVIALAQRVHDEYVEQGRQEHDRLLQEGTTRREEMIAEAEARHADLVATGQARHDELLATGEARHAELVETAQARHDELLRTGQAEHDRLVTVAQSTADELVSEAEARREQVLGELERRRSAYDAKIGELATYEQEYRDSLTAFIRTHLDRVATAAEVKPGPLPDASVVEQEAGADAEHVGGTGDGEDALPEEREVAADEQL